MPWWAAGLYAAAGTAPCWLVAAALCPRCGGLVIDGNGIHGYSNPVLHVGPMRLPMTWFVPLAGTGLALAITVLATGVLALRRALATAADNQKR